MKSVTIYTTALCGYCRAAKSLLDQKQIPYKEIPVDNDISLRREVMTRSGQRTVPQIWVGDTHVGGFTDLAALEQRGQLDPLLAD